MIFIHFIVYFSISHFKVVKLIIKLILIHLLNDNENNHHYR
jgi:hypothetical protein